MESLWLKKDEVTWQKPQSLLYGKVGTVIDTCIVEPQ